MKFVLIPNPDPPYNLIRICPNMSNLRDYGTEDRVIEHCIARNREVGLIKPGSPVYIVEESDLPGGEVSLENDRYFDAWFWGDDKVSVDMAKAKTLGLL